MAAARPSTLTTPLTTTSTTTTRTTTVDVAPRGPLAARAHRTTAPGWPSDEDGRDRAPRRRTGARRGAAPSVPLGSLTQGGVGGRGAGSTCTVCGSTSVTHLAMTLTDGTPARFTSCRRCGERRWDGSGEPLSIGEVIARATKP